MSDLTFLEKQELEAVLGMASGYVLNFSDRTFGEFVYESTKLKIDDEKYHTNGHLRRSDCEPSGRKSLMLS